MSCFTTAEFSFIPFMNPLLAITAAKVGSNLLNNLAQNVSGTKKNPPEAELRKAEFTKMMIAAANTPKAIATRELSANCIGSRSDAETQLQHIANQILQSSEVGKSLDGKPEAFELKFLPGGKVAIKNADGREKLFELEGDLAHSAQKAFDMIERVKLAFPQHGAGSGEPGGSLRMLPGAACSLLA
jgi:hypothetical protein